MNKSKLIREKVIKFKKVNPGCSYPKVLKMEIGKFAAKSHKSMSDLSRLFAVDHKQIREYKKKYLVSLNESHDDFDEKFVEIGINNNEEKKVSKLISEVLISNNVTIRFFA